MTILTLTLTLTLVASASLWDIRAGRIPNTLTYPAILAGPFLALLPWAGPGPDVTSSLAGLAVALFPALVLWTLGALGGGDVKLLAAVGGLLGYPLILEGLFHSLVAATGMGLTLILWRGEGWAFAQRLWLALMAVVVPKAPWPAWNTELRIPFAVAIALGTAWTLLLPAWRIGSGWMPG